MFSGSRGAVSAALKKNREKENKAKHPYNGGKNPYD